MDNKRIRPKSDLSRSTPLLSNNLLFDDITQINLDDTFENKFNYTNNKTIKKIERATSISPKRFNELNGNNSSKFETQLNKLNEELSKNKELKKQIKQLKNDNSDIELLKEKLKN